MAKQMQVKCYEYNTLNLRTVLWKNTYSMYARSFGLKCKQQVQYLATVVPYSDEVTVQHTSAYVRTYETWLSTVHTESSR